MSLVLFESSKDSALNSNIELFYKKKQNCRRLIVRRKKCTKYDILQIKIKSTFISKKLKCFFFRRST